MGVMRWGRGSVSRAAGEKSLMRILCVLLFFNFMLESHRSVG